MAIDDFSLQLNEGEILGIMGPNGAGKTTLLNVISGELKPDSGKVWFRGKDITSCPPHKVVKAGISRTYQIPQPFVKLTCLQNVAVPLIYVKGLPKKKALEEAEKVLDFVGFWKGKGDCAGDLDEISLKRLELARALATAPKLLLVDEIAAGLTEREIPELLEVLRRIHGEMGVTLMIIEHVIKVLTSIAHRVVVMDRGKKIFEGKPSEALCDKAVIEAYLG